MPDIIQSFWSGNPRLTAMEQLSLRSFTAQGHEFHLYSYLPGIPDLPAGVKLRNANDILPDGEQLYNRVGNWATVADVFRFQLLFQQGGWWVDTDLVALKPFESPDDYVFSSEYDKMGHQITNIGVIKVPPGDSCMEECLNYIRIRGFNNLAWGDVGVTLFRKVVEGFESERYIRKPEVFCPVNYWEMSHLVADTGYSLPAETEAVHLWNDIWRRGMLDKHARYHPGSLYEKLKHQYGL